MSILKQKMAELYSTYVIRQLFICGRNTIKSVSLFCSISKHWYDQTIVNMYSLRVQQTSVNGHTLSETTNTFNVRIN